MYATRFPTRRASRTKIASTKQVNFLRSLLNGRQHSYTQDEVGVLENLYSRKASDMIDSLVRAPYAKRETTARPAVKTVEPGFYSIGTETFKVQPSRSSDRCYAKRLVTDGKPTWEYAQGMMGRIAREGVALTLEEAKAFGKTHGFCIACARLLTDETSIANGIGPVCAKKF